MKQARGGGGTPHIKGVGMVVGNFELKPLKEANLGVAQAFLTPKRDHVKTQTIYIFLYCLACNPKRDLHG